LIYQEIKQALDFEFKKSIGSPGNAQEAERKASTGHRWMSGRLLLICGVLVAGRCILPAEKRRLMNRVKDDALRSASPGTFPIASVGDDVFLRRRDHLRRSGGPIGALRTGRDTVSNNRTPDNRPAPSRGLIAMLVLVMTVASTAAVITQTQGSDAQETTVPAINP
jgi:hypothetical protein